MYNAFLNVVYIKNTQHEISTLIRYSFILFALLSTIHHSEFCLLNKDLFFFSMYFHSSCYNFLKYFFNDTIINEANDILQKSLKLFNFCLIVHSLHVCNNYLPNYLSKMLWLTIPFDNLDGLILCLTCLYTIFRHEIAIKLANEDCQTINAIINDHIALPLNNYENNIRMIIKGYNYCNIDFRDITKLYKS